MSLRRSLVICFSSAHFTKIRALLERSQWARDPEWVIVNAIDLSARLGHDFTVGLLVCSALEPSEVDLIAVLARTCVWTWRDDVPRWDLARAARLRTAIPRTDRRTWKDRGDGPRLQQLRLRERERLRALWARLEQRLEATTACLAERG
jgi:hypothetical protein